MVKVFDENVKPVTKVSTPLPVVPVKNPDIVTGPFCLLSVKVPFKYVPPVTKLSVIPVILTEPFCLLSVNAPLEKVPPVT